MSVADFGTDVWECKRCDWFITPSALQWQVKLGLQEWPWKCPECKDLLIERESE
jgi:ribosomal protein L37AE/L43A